jgi:DNA-binding response OmpR family regulator
MSEQAATILVVDDEVNLAKGIKENLEIEGHSVEAVFHGRTALERVRASTYDLVILDVMLPGVDGFTLCKTMRDEGQTTPVLFLTAKGEATDRIRGLEAGGDDYLPKPFHLRELLLRVHAILRRSRWYDAALDRESEVRFDGNEFDFRSFKGRSWDGKEHTRRSRVARGHPRNRVGVGGISLHPNHRQLHRPPAQTVRARSRVAPVLSHRAWCWISVHPNAKQRVGAKH